MISRFWPVFIFSGKISLDLPPLLVNFVDKYDLLKKRVIPQRKKNRVGGMQLTEKLAHADENRNVPCVKTLVWLTGNNMKDKRLLLITRLKGM